MRATGYPIAFKAENTQRCKIGVKLGSLFLVSRCLKYYFCGKNPNAMDYKKTFIIIFLLLIKWFSLSAQVPAPIPVDTLIMVEKVVLPSNDQSGIHKSPASPIQVCQQGDTLCFDSALMGYTISLLLEGNEIYTTIIDENGRVDIPTTIAGTYNFELYIGMITYYTYICL